MKKNILVISGISLLLSGCGASLFANRDTNPNIQDIAVNPHFWPWSKNGVNTFATTASRRMVLVNSKDWGDTITSCAEPSPDVGEAFASAVSDALKVAASEPKTGINGSLSNEYARAVMTQITPLIYRTQSLQMYRDAIHSHCVDRMNGWYPEDNISKTENPITLEIQTVTNNSIQNIPLDSGTETNKKPTFQQQFTPKIVTLHPHDYNSVKVFYFQSAIEALKTELPYVLKAQEEFAKNLKTTGISDQNIKSLIELTKNLAPTTVTSNANGTSIVTGSNVKEENTEKESEK